MKKKIIILNWRDPKSPLEGGAERFTKEYAQHWVKKGYEVFWLTNTYKNSKQGEVVDGVTYLRIGPSLDGSLLRYLFFYPLFLVHAMWTAYLLIKKHNIDIVIDEIHGLPFFTPFFSKARNILLVCEVAGPIWDKMFPFPINIVGKNIEKLIYHFYKHTEIWAISDNTKKNIKALQPQANAKVIDLGVTEDKKIIQKASKVRKTSFPSAVFVARLVKMKGIESALLSVADIVKVLPDFKLYVMGSGQAEYESYLRDLVKRKNIESNVEFLGHVDGYPKFEVIKKSHFLLHPSYKEGFGLTVIEAGLVGVPAIIRSGSSLDALVKDGYNGFRFNRDNQIANIFIKNYQDKTHTKLSKNAETNARKYLWPDVLQRSEKITKIT